MKIFDTMRLDTEVDWWNDNRKRLNTLIEKFNTNQILYLQSLTGILIEMKSVSDPDIKEYPIYKEMLNYIEEEIKRKKDEHHETIQ